MNQEAGKVPYVAPMTDDAKGIVLKESVRRATVVIRRERAIFEAFAKESYSGTMDDVFTTADTKAQESYLRNLRECFPDYGILAEEASLSIEPKNGCTAIFTVDPLDGTKAFVRRQSHGIGTMIALVDRGEILSAFVGDINTEEVYGYRPGSTKAHRITRFESVQQLGYDGCDVLAKSYALLRDPPEVYSKLTRESIPAFKNYESSGGSIGIWFARLWKREVAALFVPPGTETPWDSNPVIGISKKLGYLFFRPGKDTDGDDAWEAYDPAPVLKVAKRDHDFLVIHRSDWRQFKGFMSF
jgi:fructose-1,6-bisphosphatase/inositol monophosphatase family enzyme